VRVGRADGRQGRKVGGVAQGLGARQGNDKGKHLSGD